MSSQPWIVTTTLDIAANTLFAIFLDFTLFESVETFRSKILRLGLVEHIVHVLDGPLVTLAQVTST